MKIKQLVWTQLDGYKEPIYAAGVGEVLGYQEVEGLGVVPALDLGFWPIFISLIIFQLLVD